MQSGKNWKIIDASDKWCSRDLRYVNNSIPKCLPSDRLHKAALCPCAPQISSEGPDSHLSGAKKSRRMSTQTLLNVHFRLHMKLLWHVINNVTLHILWLTYFPQRILHLHPSGHLRLKSVTHQAPRKAPNGAGHCWRFFPRAPCFVGRRYTLIYSQYLHMAMTWSRRNSWRDLSCKWVARGDSPMAWIKIMTWQNLKILWSSKFPQSSASRPNIEFGWCFLHFATSFLGVKVVSSAQLRLTKHKLVADWDLRERHSGLLPDAAHHAQHQGCCNGHDTSAWRRSLVLWRAYCKLGIEIFAHSPSGSSHLQPGDLLVPMSFWECYKGKSRTKVQTTQFIFCLCQSPMSNQSLFTFIRKIMQSSCRHVMFLPHSLCMQKQRHQYKCEKDYRTI